MPEQTVDKDTIEYVWRTYLMTGKMPDFVGSPWFESKFLRPFIRILPKDPRCHLCYYPFEGIGGAIVRHVIGLRRSKLNPQICNVCEHFANIYNGGAEIELSVLFADVRGSSKLAENTSPQEFSKLMNRFYKASTKVLYKSNAFVSQLMGDAVSGLFVPGFAGSEHSEIAIRAAKSIQEVAGLGKSNEPGISIGVGVHTGVAYVGAVSSQGDETDIAALGHTINTASRLCSMADTGEIWASLFACKAAGLDIESLEVRQVQLKGQSGPTDVCVI